MTEVEVRCPEKVENQVRSSAGLRFVIVWIKGEIVGFNPNHSLSLFMYYAFSYLVCLLLSGYHGE